MLNKHKSVRDGMLRSETLAAVGSLAAGVAHEINNPTGFVSSNLFTLARYIDDFKAVLDAYAHLKRALAGISDGQPLSSSVIRHCREISVLEREIDLTFVMGDSLQLIAESKAGIQRIQKIVSSLMDLVHSDYGVLEAIDINSYIESALISVLKEINCTPVILKDFSELPEVMGYPKAICQVLSNVLINAAQAVEDKGAIRITTRTQPEGVLIKIEDTGIGIARDKLGRIFDPFFTTREVGQGTGLGLSVVYNAIQCHGGNIEVSSRVGVGTTFIIHLPFHPPES
jgi:signal transduction histidine kinase